MFFIKMKSVGKNRIYILCVEDTSGMRTTGKKKNKKQSPKKNVAKELIF